MQLASFFRHGLGVALAAFVVACVATSFLGAWSVRSAFALYLCAAIVSAYFGGIRAGLLATVLAILGLLAQRHVLPAMASHWQGVDFAPGLVLFGVVGVMASWLSSECGRVVAAATRTATQAVVDGEQPQCERFQTLAADLPGGLVLLGADGQCSYCNARAGVLGGFTAEEGLGDGWTRFVHSEDQEIVREWQAAARREKPFESELRFQDRQGRVRWTQLRAVPLRQRDGGYLGLAGLLEDTSAWKEVEDDLGRQQKAAEDLKRGHQEQMREIEGRLASIQKTQAILQAQLQEKQQAEEETRRSHALERGNWKQREQELQEQLAELRRMNEDLEEQQEALGEAEELRREFARRKAEWQQAEEELRREIAELHDGEKQRGDLERKQADWKRTEAQLRRELAELRKSKQSLEEAIAEQRHGEEKQRKEFQDQVETVKLLEEELAVWQRKETAARSELERLLPELQELKDREETRRRGGSALDRVAERLHPLVAGLNEAVHANEHPTPVRDRMWHLNHFAEGLWAACRVARHELPMRTEPLEAAALVRRVAESALPLLRERGHHLTLRLPLDPQWLSADPVRLEQALAALVDNAAHYTEPGGQIELNAERWGNEVVFRVTDTGRGIEAGELPALRALDARDRRFGDGLGVGLALVRGLIESQGGQVEVSSDGAEKGSEFRLRFPALNTNGVAVAA